MRSARLCETHVLTGRAVADAEAGDPPFRVALKREARRRCGSRKTFSAHRPQRHGLREERMTQYQISLFGRQGVKRLDLIAAVAAGVGSEIAGRSDGGIPGDASSS